LSAFDAAGSTKCVGAPKTCAPLWSVPLVGSGNAPPAVPNGIVYLGVKVSQTGRQFTGTLYAFGAAGQHQLLGHAEDMRSTLERLDPSVGVTCGGQRDCLRQRR
jgi:hypothetical protein